jgi:hypothetical protein
MLEHRAWPDRTVESPMPQPVPANTSRLFSVSGTFGDAQIVAIRSRVLFDLQTRNYDAGGILRRHHALANLPLDTASQIRDLLSQAIAAAAEAPEHQPGLWSEATTAHIARRLQPIR